MIKRLNESYSDINSENVWDAYDIAAEYLGDIELGNAMAKAMGTDALADVLRYIFRVYKIPFMEDDEYEEEDYEEEEYFESCGGKKKNLKETDWKTDTIEVIKDFFEKKGWDTSNEEVLNYIDGVYELLSIDPEWIDGDYTLDNWYADTKDNYPEDIEWLDSTK